MASVNKIVILGGGSAGWMTASTLINHFPEKDITVIESPNVPIVGVGESTIAQINFFMNDLGIKDDDWMQACDASYKLSIKFTDFYKEGAGGFHYPFGEPHMAGTTFGFNDWFLKKMHNPSTPAADFADCFFPSMALVTENKISENKNGEFPEWRFDRHVAYHMDAVKFGAWLRSNYAVPKGVKHIPDTVINSPVTENGVEYLELSSGEKVTADLFIDCTGFRALLIDKALKVPFTSYKDILPNDSAWATRVVYQDKENELEPYTNCTAIDNGWVWNIPLWSRIGTGYVYSSDYVSDENALEEFKNYLINNRSVQIPKETVDTLEFRNIKMRVGIHKKIWTKNVCAIGLAAGFIEPLESNGLYTVHEFLKNLVSVLYKESISGFDKAEFNSVCETDFRSFAEFVSLHYALSQRDSTQYWRDRQAKEEWKPNDFVGFYLPYGIDHLMYKHGIDNRLDFSMGGISIIAAGMNHNPANKLVVKRAEFLLNRDFNFVKNIFPLWETFKNQWKDFASTCPTLYEYLKNKYKE